MNNEKIAIKSTILKKYAQMGSDCAYVREKFSECIRKNVCAQTLSEYSAGVVSNEVFIALCDKIMADIEKIDDPCDYSAMIAAFSAYEGQLSQSIRFYQEYNPRDTTLLSINRLRMQGEQAMLVEIQESIAYLRTFIDPVEDAE